MPHSEQQRLGGCTYFLVMFHDDMVAICGRIFEERSDLREVYQIPVYPIWWIAVCGTELARQ